MAMHNPPHPGEFISGVYLVPNNLSGRELAAKLGESETAVRSAIYRMRRRFARLMREQIAATLAPGEDVEEEVRYLARVLA